MMLLINKRIELTAPADSLILNLCKNEADAFSVRKVKENEVKFLSNNSIGTIFISGWGGLEGIKLYGKFYQSTNGKTRLTLTTSFRFELLVVLFVWVLLLALYLTGIGDIPSQVVFIVMPIFFLVNGTVYRIQEEILLKKVEQTLLAIG